MVQERHETLIRVYLCTLPNPVGRMWHACPLLCTARVLASRISPGPSLGSPNSAQRCRPLLAGLNAAMDGSDLFERPVIGLGFPLFSLRPRTTAGRLEGLPIPGGALLYVPWFLDPGMPHFASLFRLMGVAFDPKESLGASNQTVFEAQSSSLHMPLPMRHQTPRGSWRTARDEGPWSGRLLARACR